MANSYRCKIDNPDLSFLTYNFSIQDDQSDKDRQRTKNNRHTRRAIKPVLGC